MSLARQKAATAWCKETTKHKVMDIELAEASNCFSLIMNLIPEKK